MNISGKVVQILQEMKGEGKNGPWSRQDFIIETNDQYPKKVCISVWNNKINLSNLNPGDPVSMDISVESREYNGRWYTDVKALSLSTEGKKEENGMAQTRAPWEEPAGSKLPPPPSDAELAEQEDDLPF